VARFIQCPETRKLIPAEDYHRHQAERDLSAFVQEDIKPFVSPVDGSIISTRADLRHHNRKHGVTDPRDYGPDWFERKAKERQADMRGESRGSRESRLESIQEALYKHGH